MSLPRFNLMIHARVGAAFVPFLRRHLRAAVAYLPQTLEQRAFCRTDLRNRQAAKAARFAASRFRESRNTNGRVALDDLSLALVDDATMSDLHERYMNIPGPADVLTFPLDERSGEIVICVPEARRRAKERGIRVENELLLYAIHGMLHLCGMDDRTRSGFEKMHRMEDIILTKIGVGAVFTDSGKINTRSLKRPRQKRIKVMR